MIRNNYSRFLPGILIVLFFTLSSSTFICQTEGQEWLQEMKNIQNNTVLLNNGTGLVPILNLPVRKIASVDFGAPFPDVFDSLLNKYTTVESYSANNAAPTATNQLNSDLKLFNTVIIQATALGLNNPLNRGLLRDLDKNKDVILVLYGNPSVLNDLDSLRAPVIWCPQSSRTASEFTAQLIFGGIGASARLNADISAEFTKGSGYSTQPIRLKYTVPEEVGISSQSLEVPIDHIMQGAIQNRATPGAVVMVVKDGKVIFNKAYGTHTYQDEVATRVTDIFDLASVTKISATTIAAMRLYEEHKLSLDSPLSAYVPLARNTNKSDIRVKELMLHEAGLIPYIPFHNSIHSGDFSRDSSEAFPVKVADNYFLRKGYYEEVMLPRMLSTPLRNRGRYEYSDLSMYFMKEVIERQASQSLDSYVLQQFYAPLGMQTAGYNPRLRFDRSRIVPTENDTYFRKTLLWGYVHDQGAALAGGVSGHAGVFASANDLAILFQMLLNGGSYGQQQYFRPETIALFTSRQSAVSRRGYGFDRWDPERSKKYPSELASPQTFGHTGFTGTCVWVDPKYNLVYIFLSNRLNGQSANKLSSFRIRPRIQDAIYTAILNSQHQASDQRAQ